MICLLGSAGWAFLWECEILRVNDGCALNTIGLW